MIGFDFDKGLYLFLAEEKNNKVKEAVMSESFCNPDESLSREKTYKPVKIREKRIWRMRCPSTSVARLNDSSETDKQTWFYMCDNGLACDGTIVLNNNNITFSTPKFNRFDTSGTADHLKSVLMTYKKFEVDEGIRVEWQQSFKPVNTCPFPIHVVDQTQTNPAENAMDDPRLSCGGVGIHFWEDNWQLYIVDSMHHHWAIVRRPDLFGSNAFVTIVCLAPKNLDDVMSIFVDEWGVDWICNGYLMHSTSWNEITKGGKLKAPVKKSFRLSAGLFTFLDVPSVNAEGYLVSPVRFSSELCEYPDMIVSSEIMDEERLLWGQGGVLSIANVKVFEINK